MKLSFVLISHNVKSYIGDCIDSIQSAIKDIRSTIDHAEIIIVDRSSDDGTAQAARSATDCTVIDVPFAEGWAVAANKGVAKASGDILVFVAPEAALLAGGLPRLLEYLEKNPACAIAGGAVVSPHGSLLQGATRFPGILSTFTKSTGLAERFTKTPLNWARYGGKDFQRPALVDVVSFSYAAVKADAFYKLGGFDSRFFSDFAGADLCRRAHRSMLPRPTVAYIPQARARALDGFVLRSEADSYDMGALSVVRHRTRSEQLYAWKQYGMLGATLITLTSLAGQSIRYVLNVLPVVGKCAQAKYSKAVLSETCKAALDTQLGSQYPTTPW